jgi:hypothetical protein
MVLPNFPSLAGQGFATKTPVTASLVAVGDSGREIRTSIYGGLYQFEVAFDGLSSESVSNPGLGAASLQELMGFYLQCAGGLGTFLYTDPNDNNVANQIIATGDGATNEFPFMRRIGLALERVGFVTGVASITLNGVPQPSGWSLIAPNILSFAAAPPPGASIAASFNYAFVCRFIEDEVAFENFMQNLWATRSLKFRSVQQ